MSGQITGGVETSPNGRYIRFDEKLGFGAYKDVWKSYDTETGREVAWNTVSLRKLPLSEQRRIESETTIMRKIKHPNIIKIFDSWENPAKEQICFTTEIVSSGTLKQYVQRIGKVKLKIIKKWCRQVLTALAYLHGLNPPVIHRDLKCDNIFINGATSDIRLGDFGLSAARDRTYAQSVLGTPEFMAPELYEENYTEKVDIYAFGMVVLEIATGEYPYAECRNAAQIWRRVSVDHIKPAVLTRIRNSDVRSFVELCLLPAKFRLSAEELLNHPFIVLQDTYQDADVVTVDEPQLPNNTLQLPENIPETATSVVTDLDSEEDNYGSDTTDTNSQATSSRHTSTTVTTTTTNNNNNNNSMMIPRSGGIIQQQHPHQLPLHTSAPAVVLGTAEQQQHTLQLLRERMSPESVMRELQLQQQQQPPFHQVQHAQSAVVSMSNHHPQSHPQQHSMDLPDNHNDTAAAAAAAAAANGNSVAAAQTITTAAAAAATTTTNDAAPAPITAPLPVSMVSVPVSKVGILVKELPDTPHLVHLTVEIHFGTGRKRKRIKFNYDVSSDDPSRVAMDMVETLQLPAGPNTSPLLQHAIAAEVNAFLERRRDQTPHHNQVMFFQMEEEEDHTQPAVASPTANTPMYIDDNAVQQQQQQQQQQVQPVPAPPPPPPKQRTPRASELTTAATTDADGSATPLASGAVPISILDAPLPDPVLSLSAPAVTSQSLPDSLHHQGRNSNESNDEMSEFNGGGGGGGGAHQSSSSSQVLDIDYGEKLRLLTDNHIRVNREFDRRLKDKLTLIKELEDRLLDARTTLEIIERERKLADEEYDTERQVLSERAGVAAEQARKRLEREEERRKTAKEREEQARQEEVRLMESIQSSLFPL